MKHDNKKQYAGVWLDNQNAIIITHTEEADKPGYSIREKVKAGGNHSGGSEHTMNNAKQADMLRYLKSVSQLLLHYDEILIFGPGKSQEQLQNHLQDDAQFRNKLITIDSADQLTDPQMIAKVRDFFKTRQS